MSQELDDVSHELDDEAIAISTFTTAWDQFVETPRHPRSVALSIRRRRRYQWLFWTLLLACSIVMYVVEEGVVRQSWWTLGVLGLGALSMYMISDRKTWQELASNTALVWEEAPLEARNVLQRSDRFANVLAKREAEDKGDELKGPVRFFFITTMLGLVPYGVAKLFWPEKMIDLTGLLLGIGGLAGIVSLLLCAFLFMFVFIGKLARRQEDVEMQHIKAVAPEIFHGDVIGALTLDDKAQLEGALGLVDGGDDR